MKRLQRTGDAPEPSGGPAAMAESTPSEACAGCWREADGTHLDVRGLSPPQPLVRILRVLRTLPRDALLIVHHDRDPLMLYGELAQIGWGAERVAGEPGEFRLRLAAIEPGKG